MLHNVPLKAFTLQKGVEVTLWQCFCNGKMYACFEVRLIGAEMKISQPAWNCFWSSLCLADVVVQVLPGADPDGALRSRTPWQRPGELNVLGTRGCCTWRRRRSEASGRSFWTRGCWPRSKGLPWRTGRSEAMVRDEAAKQGNTVKSDRVNGWIKRSSCTNVCLSYGSCDAQGRNREILSRSILMSV